MPDYKLINIIYKIKTMKPRIFSL